MGRPALGVDISALGRSVSSREGGTSTPGADRSALGANRLRSLLEENCRDAAYRLREERETEGHFEGWALESREAWGAVVGHLRYFDPAVVSGLQVLEGLMRSPWALALLLTACGKTAIEKAGAILDSWIPPSR